jgi:hypothetical protein
MLVFTTACTTTTIKLTNDLDDLKGEAQHHRRATHHAVQLQAIPAQTLNLKLRGSVKAHGALKPGFLEFSSTFCNSTK